MDTLSLERELFRLLSETDSLVIGIERKTVVDLFAAMHKARQRDLLRQELLALNLTGQLKVTYNISPEERTNSFERLVCKILETP